MIHNQDHPCKAADIAKEITFYQVDKYYNEFKVEI